MKAMVLPKIVSLDEVDTPLELVDLDTPKPGPGEVLIQVAACGVCHTELDEIEGRTPPPKFPVVLGHEVVGRVVENGHGAALHAKGDRVGVGWIYSSTGSEDENVSPKFRATGRDANGGYAEFMTVPEDYAYKLPDGFASEQAAPLLCAGAIGYRSLRLTNLNDGDPLGLTGFGGSAHLVVQMARNRFPNSKVYVFARDPEQRDFAKQLGACWAGDTDEKPPEDLQAIIDTTPAWKPVVAALACLRPGGRLVINAIRKQDGDKDALRGLSYHDHLWLEREIKSVANITGRDIKEFLAVAAEIPLKPEVTTYHLEQANKAILELKRGSVRGAKVLVMNE